MSDGLLEFGNIFEYNGSEYIFLAGQPDVNYAAKILNTKVTKQLEHLRLRSASANRKLEKPVYCFVVLTTAEVKDRAAFWGRSQQEANMIFNKLNISLNNTDLKNLKKDIEDSRAAPIALKEMVSAIKI
jgi:hypothetical protein